MILAKLYQKFLPKCNILASQAQRTVFFYPLPALNLRLKVFTKLHDFSSKNTTFSSFWGTPSDNPCAHKHAFGADAPPNHLPKCPRRIYTPVQSAGIVILKQNIELYFWKRHDVSLKGAELNHTNKITIWWWFSESHKQNHNPVMIFWITQTKSQSGGDFLNHTNKITIRWWFSESCKQNHNLVMIFWITQTKSQSGGDFLNHTNKITIWWWFSESHKQNHNLVMIFWITQTKSQSGDDFQKYHWYGKVIFRQKKKKIDNLHISHEASGMEANTGTFNSQF